MLCDLSLKSTIKILNLFHNIYLFCYLQFLFAFLFEVNLHNLLGQFLKVEVPNHNAVA